MIMTYIITYTKVVMFLPVSCWFVGRITLQQLNFFVQNLGEGRVLAQNRPCELLVLIQIEQQIQEFFLPFSNDAR